jgi:O-acetyl-ADP-ribose deacetylase
VGPVWHGGERGEPELLASCYRRSLELAAGHALESVAFPCISTGVYGYPMGQATRIAIDTVRATLAEQATLREIIFCCFSAGALALYERELL